MLNDHNDDSVLEPIYQLQVSAPNPCTYSNGVYLSRTTNVSSSCRVFRSVFALKCWIFQCNLSWIRLRTAFVRVLSPWISRIACHYRHNLNYYTNNTATVLPPSTSKPGPVRQHKCWVLASPRRSIWVIVTLNRSCKVISSDRAPLMVGYVFPHTSISPVDNFFSVRPMDVTTVPTNLTLIATWQ